jgi:hypothetical protein
MITVKRKAKFVKAKLRRKSAEEPVDRVPRVARLMALAIRFDQLIRDGVVADQAELARLGHVSRARVTQVINLLCLSPKIQEQLLFLSVSPKGRASVTERQMRPIADIACWQQQSRAWTCAAKCE